MKCSTWNFLSARFEGKNCEDVGKRRQEMTSEMSSLEKAK